MQCRVHSNSRHVWHGYNLAGKIVYIARCSVGGLDLFRYGFYTKLEPEEIDEFGSESRGRRTKVKAITRVGYARGEIDFCRETLRHDARVGLLRKDSNESGLERSGRNRIPGTEGRVMVMKASVRNGQDY